MLETELSKQIEKYTKWLNKAELDYSNLPEGKLRISTSDGEARYYLIDKSSSRFGNYIPKNSEIKQAIAQRQYLERAIPVIKQLLYQMSKLLSSLQKNKLSFCYENLIVERKKLVTPFELPTDLFVKQWE